MPRGDQLTRKWKLVQLLAGRVGRTLAEVLEPEVLREQIGRNHIALARRAGRGFGHRARPKTGGFGGTAYE